MRVFPRFDFTSEIPSLGNGGFNKDGVLGIYGKGSAEEVQARLDARRFNEYERVMALLSEGLGDFDFTETFPGLKIMNASDGIRRLKTELNAALALILGVTDGEELDTRLYGIETDWVKSSVSTVGSIFTDYYTPGISIAYEPAFDIISTDVDSIKILGGRLNIPGKQLVIPPSGSADGAYEFDLPETEMIQNVEYVFGPGMSLPAGNDNRVHVINGRFNLPVTNLAINFQGKPLGTLVYGLGAGVKQFKFVDISGTNEKDVSIVLVSGTEVDGYIDVDSPVSYHLGVDTFRSGDVETVPVGYDVLVDPLSSSGKTSGMSDGTYYAFYIVPDTKGYFLGVKTNSGLISIEEALITENGELKTQDSVFPLYFIKGEFNPVASALGSVTEESKIYTYRRVGNSLEHSVNNVFTDDALVDVRRFKNKPRPVFIPPWVPKGFLDGEVTIRSDIHGNIKKVLPLFFPIKLKHTKERYTIQKIKDLSLVESEEITAINHQAYTPFNYLYFEDSLREENERVLGRMVTGSDGIFPKVLGFFGSVKYLSNSYTDLSVIDSDLYIEVFVQNKEGVLVFHGTTQDLSNIYSWNIDSSSRLDIEALTDLDIKVKTTKNVGNIIYLEDFNIVLSPIYTKIGTTAAGSSFKEIYDLEVGPTRTSSGLKFENDFKLKVTRKISSPEGIYLNKEYYDVSKIANESSVLLDLGLSAIPKWWKTVFSQVNQYVLIYTSDNFIKLVRIGIANPNDFEIVNCDFNLIPGEQIKASLFTSDIYEVGLDLEIIIPERPKVIGVVQGSDYIYTSVLSYLEGISYTPQQDTVYEYEDIDMSVWKVIGTTRTFMTDPENSNLPGNLDVLDGRRVIVRSNQRIQIHEIPHKIYMNYIGYISKEKPTVFEFDYSSYFSNTSDLALGYVENRRNSEERPKDNGVYQDRRYCSFGLWSHIENKFILFTLLRELSEENNFAGTTLMYSNEINTDVNLDYPKFFRSGIWFEIAGLDALNDEHRFKYHPYRGELIEHVTDLDYEIVSSYSLGTVVVAADSAENRYNIQKETGSSWSDDIVPDFLERYKSLQSRIDSLIFGKGLAYKLNIFNSDPKGLTREISTDESFLAVANYRTYPDPGVFGSDKGIGRRVGKFSKNQDSETAYFITTTPRTSETLSERPGKYNITLFTPKSWISGFSTWPTYLPFKTRSEITSGEEAEIFVELGSASGSSIDSGIINREEKLSDYGSEFVRKSSELDTYELHSVRSTLSKYPTSTEDVLETDISLPSDRPFIKYGNGVEDSLDTPLADQVYIDLAETIDAGDSNHTVTTVIGDTSVAIGFPFDSANLYRYKFEKVSLVFVTQGAPASGILRIQFSDTSGVLHDAEYSFVRSYVVWKQYRLEVITLNTNYDLEAKNSYTLKVAVKTGQSFSTIDFRKLTTENRICYSIRYIANSISTSLTNSIWENVFDLKLGDSSIWTPYVKKLNTPWELRIGLDSVKDKPIPFITSTRKYGAVVSRGSSSKIIATCERDQWREEVVPGTNVMEPVFYDETVSGWKVLVLIDRTNQQLKVYRKESEVWIPYTIGGITVGSSDKVVASNSFDRGVIVASVMDSGSTTIKYLEIDAYTPSFSFTSLDTSISTTNVTEMKICSISTWETLIAIKKNSGAVTDFTMAFVNSTSVINVQTVDNISNTFTDITLNQATYFGSCPYVVYSWGAPGNYYIKTVTCKNYAEGTTPVWSISDLSLTSGGGSGYTAGTKVHAFVTKPGYLVYSPGVNQEYKIIGWRVQPSPIDEYHSMILRQKDATDFVEDIDNNFLWFSGDSGLTTGMYCWSLAVPIPYYNGIVYYDQWNHNNWLWLDRQNSRFITTSAFWNQIRVKHSIRYRDVVEDTLKGITSSNSSYTDKIDSMISLASTARLQTNVDIAELFNALMTGMHLGWSTSYNGADLTKPDYKLYSKGTERIKLTFTYVPSGPASGKVDSILYEYSQNSGVDYVTLAEEQFTYNGLGHLQSSAFA